DVSNSKLHRYQTNFRPYRGGRTDLPIGHCQHFGSAGVIAHKFATLGSGPSDESVHVGWEDLEQRLFCGTPILCPKALAIFSGQRMLQARAGMLLDFVNEHA